MITLLFRLQMSQLDVNRRFFVDGPGSGEYDMAGRFRKYFVAKGLLKYRFSKLFGCVWQ